MRIVARASNTLEKIPVSLPVRRHITSDHIPFRVDSIALAGSRTRNIYGNELRIAQDKTVLVSVLAIVEANEVSLGVHARDPGKGGVGNVDRF